MSINKPDIIEFFHNPKNKIIISFMDSCSEKLNLISNKIDRERRKYRFLQLLMLILSTPIIGYLLFFDSSLFAKLALLALTSVFIFNIFSKTRKLKLLCSEAREIAFKLEEIVRSMSQIHEHSIRDEVQRTEVDLYLAKSESILEHYYRANIGGSRLS